MRSEGDVAKLVSRDDSPIEEHELFKAALQNRLLDGRIAQERHDAPRQEVDQVQQIGLFVGGHLLRGGQQRERRRRLRCGERRERGSERDGLLSGAAGAAAAAVARLRRRVEERAELGALEQAEDTRVQPARDQPAAQRHGARRVLRELPRDAHRRGRDAHRRARRPVLIDVAGRTGRAHLSPADWLGGVTFTPAGQAKKKEK